MGDGNFITQSFLLIVDDINDNAPIFKPYQNTIFVPENSLPTVIATVEATDADEGPYGQVTLQQIRVPRSDDRHPRSSSFTLYILIQQCSFNYIVHIW